MTGEHDSRSTWFSRREIMRLFGIGAGLGLATEGGRPASLLASVVQSGGVAPQPREVPAVKALGDFIKSVRYADLPPSVQAGSKARLLNAVGAAFASRITGRRPRGAPLGLPGSRAPADGTGARQGLAFSGSQARQDRMIQPETVQGAARLHGFLRFSAC